MAKDAAHGPVEGEGSATAARASDGASPREIGVKTRTGAPRKSLRAGIGRLVRAIRDGDEAMVESAVVSLSQSRRLFAPLAFLVGAFIMLFDGLKLLVLNWRLTLVQVLPAMWIWLATFDLKAHILHGRGFHHLNGGVLVAAVVLIMVITAASFYLNAVFAFAIAAPPPPRIRPAFGQVRDHTSIVIGSGVFVGLALGVSTMVLSRWGTRWFGLATGIVIGIMMFCYVAVPTRILGIKKTSDYSRRDKLAASAMGGTVGAIICTPPYVIARIGILMLGSKALFVPGLFVLTFGVTVQAGATGSVKALKMSSKIIAARRAEPQRSDADRPNP
ncbi:MAG TPA: hypothetical protein VL119_03520 [Acidimicrobiia bacterium]|nr:hypothetical protein [Acidimicrobiia bacterium]